MNPVRDGNGAVASAQTCTDGDRCDGNPTAGVCGFDVAACLGRADARTPACTAADGLVAKPREAGTGRRESWPGLSAGLAALAGRRLHRARPARRRLAPRRHASGQAQARVRCAQRRRRARIATSWSSGACPRGELAMRASPSSCSRWLAVAAAEAPPGTFGGPVRLEETVVTGTKIETKRWEATVPTQVVPSERIEETATVTSRTRSARSPGLYVRRNEQFRLGASTIRMQGADPNKVAILVDGRRFRGGVDGVVDLRDIGANNVERIEVIRGPGVEPLRQRRDGRRHQHHHAPGCARADARRRSARSATSHAASRAASHGWQVGPVRYFLTAQHDEFRLFEQFPGTQQPVHAARTGTRRRTATRRALRLDADPAPGHGVTFSPSFQQQTDPESIDVNWALGGEWRWETSEDSRLTTWANRYALRSRERPRRLPGGRRLRRLGGRVALGRRRCGPGASGASIV